MRSHAVLDRSDLTAARCISVLLLLVGGTALGQAPIADPPAQQGMADAANQNRQLADQITELRAQAARLQAAVEQTGPGKKVRPKSVNPASNKAIGMTDDNSEMGMPAGKGATMTSGEAAKGMKNDQGEMGAPAPAMGMCCAGEKGLGENGATSAMPPAASGPATMSGTSSAMVGQAGATHLYHIGSNGFFLNHSQHLTLTPDQNGTLSHLKEKTTLEQASEQRRIDQSEQELFTLTGADQADNPRIQAKIAEIEKLRAAQRMNFIRAVEDAAHVLTPEQRKAILGTMAATGK